jgi:Mn-dependent DtxR family transcriptional regulator
MAGLSSRDQAVLRLAVGTGRVTVRRCADQLHLSRAVAGATLRALERAGHLIGGGEIGYRATSQGRQRLDAVAREAVTGKTSPACRGGRYTP